MLCVGRERIHGTMGMGTVITMKATTRLDYACNSFKTADYFPAMAAPLWRRERMCRRSSFVLAAVCLHDFKLNHQLQGSTERM